MPTPSEAMCPTNEERTVNLFCFHTTYVDALIHLSMVLNRNGVCLPVNHSSPDHSLTASAPWKLYFNEAEFQVYGPRDRVEIPSNSNTITMWFGS